MTIDSGRLNYLLNQYAENECSRQELEELFTHIREAQNNDEFQVFLQQEWNAIKPGESIFQVDWDTMYNRVVQMPVIGLHPKSTKRLWHRVAAAAVLIGLVAGSYFLFFNKSDKSEKIVKREQLQDIEAPKSTRATITMADGKIVVVDSLSSIAQGNVKILRKSDGQLEYMMADGGWQVAVQYNTLTNPRGSKVINLTLSDGTKVWLNSESSIRYPVAFLENERAVEITGEGYFEVAKSAGKKFIVVSGDVITEVLGTHFNVNSYDDADGVKVTLLEGKVRVSTIQNSKSKIQNLIPGQQAISMGNGQLAINNQVDVEQVMSWKNGKFLFNDANIESIMKEIGRWYDVEVVYETKIPGGFVADLSRNNPVSKLLFILEQTNRVHFSVEGKKVKVKP